MPENQPVARTELIELLAINQQQTLTAISKSLADFSKSLADFSKSLVTKDELAASLAAFKSELLIEMAERIDAAELCSRQHTEHIETRLLTALHNWASPVDHRLRKLESSDGGVLERLAMVEARLTNLELKA